MTLSKREQEIIYFALSRQLDDKELTREEFYEIDNLREQYKLEELQ